MGMGLAMGMGVPWDFHGNGNEKNNISMQMGMMFVGLGIRRNIRMAPKIPIVIIFLERSFRTYLFRPFVKRSTSFV